MDANFGFRKTSLTLERRVFICFLREVRQCLCLQNNLMLGAALVLSGSSPLFAAETAANAVVAASPRAYVNCPGVSNVPMTADPEQALPLRQTAILACGQQVAVLADNEGYTTQIRTSDGKVGYVARMYLTTRDAGLAAGTRESSTGLQRHARKRHRTLDRRRPGLRPVHQPRPQSGIRHRQRPHRPSSLQDTGWKLHGQRRGFERQAALRSSCFPRSSHSTKLTPKLRNLRQENPAKLARNEGQFTSLCTANPLPFLRPAQSFSARALPRMFPLWPTTSRPLTTTSATTTNRLRSRTWL